MIQNFLGSAARVAAVLVITGMSVFATMQPLQVAAQNSASVVVPSSDDSVVTPTATPTITPTPTPDTVNADLQQTLDNLCAGANFEIGSTCANSSVTNLQAEESFSRLIKTIVNIFSTVVGVVAVIMILIGGLRYITSGGDSSSVSSAKNTILYVVVGLVVVAMSQLIVRFVVSRLQAAT